MFCENRASERPFDRRRRILPIVYDSDLSIDIKRVTSFDALNEAKPTHIPPPPSDVLESPGDYSSANMSFYDLIHEVSEEKYQARLGFRRNAIDEGGHRSSSSSSEAPTTMRSRVTGPAKDKRRKDSKPKRTVITYCPDDSAVVRKPRVDIV